MEAPLARATQENIVHLLKDHTAEWTERKEALGVISKVVQAPTSNNEFILSYFTAIQPLICIQLDDRRSIYCREVCDLITAVARKLGDNFESLSTGFITALFRLLVVTVRVIAESSHKCILSLLPFSSSSIPLIYQGTKDKHPFLRARCMEYMCRLVEGAPTEKLNNESYLVSIDESIRSAIADSNAEARTIAKRSYQSFNKRFPQEAQRLLASLDPAIQKRLVETEKPSAKKGGFAEFLAKKQAAKSTNQESDGVLVETVISKNNDDDDDGDGGDTLTPPGSSTSTSFSTVITISSPSRSNSTTTTTSTSSPTASQSHTLAITEPIIAPLCLERPPSPMDETPIVEALVMETDLVSTVAEVAIMSTEESIADVPIERPASPMDAAPTATSATDAVTTMDTLPTTIDDTIAPAIADSAPLFTIDIAPLTTIDDATTIEIDATPLVIVDLSSPTVGVAPISMDITPLLTPVDIIPAPTTVTFLPAIDDETSTLLISEGLELSASEVAEQVVVAESVEVTCVEISSTTPVVDMASIIEEIAPACVVEVLTPAPNSPLTVDTIAASVPVMAEVVAAATPEKVVPSPSTQSEVVPMESELAEKVEAVVVPELVVGPEQAAAVVDAPPVAASEKQLDPTKPTIKSTSRAATSSVSATIHAIKAPSTTIISAKSTTSTKPTIPTTRAATKSTVAPKTTTTTLTTKVLSERTNKLASEPLKRKAPAVSESNKSSESTKTVAKKITSGAYEDKENQANATVSAGEVQPPAKKLKVSSPPQADSSIAARVKERRVTPKPLSSSSSSTTSTSAPKKTTTTSSSLSSSSTTSKSSRSSSFASPTSSSSLKNAKVAATSKPPAKKPMWV